MDLGSLEFLFLIGLVIVAFFLFSRCSMKCNGSSTPLWSCAKPDNEYCYYKDSDIRPLTKDMLLTNDARHPDDCATLAVNNNYAAFAAVMYMSDGKNVSTSCYGLKDTDIDIYIKNSDNIATNGRCPDYTCTDGEFCFGDVSENSCPLGKDKSGGNKTGGPGYRTYVAYCVGKTQNELDECLNKSKT